MLDYVSYGLLDEYFSFSPGFYSLTKSISISSKDEKDNNNSLGESEIVFSS